ncbi:MAG: DNA-directed RNA polymerase subunit delta [Symbiobacterium sp.]|uniref:DNA-directed RNA polymerase subunit delta n=1 Tax=Symbiobacterium sp. TaxID=1971213 RepID=UPI00346458E9
MDLKPDMSVTDLAYTILKKHGKPMHFKQLISEVMQVKAIHQENPGRLIAQMHTEINLDSRFIHQGGGEWGLREWQPKSAKVRTRPESGQDADEAVLDEDELDLVGEEEEEDEELEDELEDEFGLEDEEEEDLSDDEFDEDR